MKKLLGCFLCAMLLVFGAALSVQAYPIDPRPDFIESWSDGTYLGGTLDLLDIGWTINGESVQQPNLTNINKVIELYNEDNDPDYDTLDEPIPDPLEDGDPVNQYSGTITLDGNTQFLTLKWDRMFGLWDVSGLNEFTFNGLSNELSGYRCIPDATTLVLLGSAMVGLGVFGRKKVFKRS